MDGGSERFHGNVVGRASGSWLVTASAASGRQAEPLLPVLGAGESSVDAIGGGVPDGEPLVLGIVWI